MITILLKKPKPEYVNPALVNEAAIIAKHGSMPEYYDTCQIACKVKDQGSIFITAEGLLMPCCWTAGRMYKWWHTDFRVEQIWGSIDAAGGKGGIDVVVNDLEHVIDNSGLLQHIESSWNKPSVSAGKLGICANKCGTEFDAYSEQFK